MIWGLAPWATHCNNFLLKKIDDISPQQVTTKWSTPQCHLSVLFKYITSNKNKTIFSLANKRTYFITAKGELGLEWFATCLTATLLMTPVHPVVFHNLLLKWMIKKVKRWNINVTALLYKKKIKVRSQLLCLLRMSHAKVNIIVTSFMLYRALFLSGSNVVSALCQYVGR